MGIEEPEIYQHPPQVRHLAETLLELSEKDSQIMVCSHNPLFVRGDNFESIRLVREKGSPSESYISRISYDSLSYELAKAQHGKKVLKEKGMLAKLYPSLNPVINEMFFCNNLILTEGIEDVAYISTYLLLTDNMEVFRQYGGHIVPAGRKSEIIKPLAIAKLLNLPVFVVCDADTDKENDEIQMHKKDNKSILSLLGYDHLNEWPKNNIYENNLTMWNKNITEVIKTEFNGKWEKFKTIANSFYGEPGGLSKNPLAIAFALEKAWKEGLISHELMNLINRIISFIKG
jgi:predicted ATP-dependent endonuclease of OLD family